MKKSLIILMSLLFLCFGIFSNSAKVFSAQNISQVTLLRSYKDITHRIWAVNKLKTQAATLSEADKNTIVKYVGGAVRGENTFLLINCYLRDNLSDYLKPKDINKPLKCRLKFYTDNLSRSVSKSTLQQNTILYRSLDEIEIKGIFKDKTIQAIFQKPVSDAAVSELKTKLSGEKISEKGFMITSYDKNVLQQSKYRFEIKAPKGTQAVLLDNILPKHEKLILVNSGYNWEVVNIFAGKDKQNQNYYNIVIKYTNR